MISEAQLHGGAKFTTISGGGQTFVALGSGRVQKFNNTTGATRDVVLPAPSQFRSDQTGGATWYVLNASTSTGSVTVKYLRSDGSQVTLVTLAAGHNATVLLLSVGPAVADEKYTYLARQKNTARTSATGTRGAITTPDTRGSLNPLDCFEGNECERSRSMGNAPLDGQGGRATVLAPMFYNSCDALNLKREPIRAADVVMPSVVTLKFTENEFTVDAAHPEAGGGLSDEFFAALYNNTRPHGLTYDGAANGRSDHWHHVRHGGAFPYAWSMKTGGLTVRRHVWIKQIPYGPEDNPTQYTLEIRFVLEHTINPEPSPACSGGGVNDTTYGSWGSLFMVYVFTDEIRNGDADPISYTPAGSGSSIAFTRDNPCIWGDADGIGEGQDDKFCHPQMVICANLATTFQSPCLSNFVPILDREETTEGVKLRNMGWCYTVGNGAPWCTCNNSPNAIARDYGIKSNVVFGNVECAAMTLGGDDVSQPLEFVTIENGAGVGRTVCQPTRAGWDDDCGTLDVATGSSISVAVCVGDNHCGDAADCVGGWPTCEVTPCTGHPDEPFETIGGTHSCFNNAGAANNTPCCIGIENAQTLLRQACVRDTTTYDETCFSVDTGCFVTGYRETPLELMLEDYDYQMGGTPTSRSISWLQYRPDPTHPARDYDYNNDGSGELTSEFGTWVTNPGEIDVTAFSGATDVRALLTFNRTSLGSWGWWGNEQTVTINKFQLGTHGVGSGYNSAGTFQGVGGLTKSTGVNQVTVYINKYTAGVRTVLASAVINTAASTASVTWRQHGAAFTFTVTPSGGSATVLTAHDCSVDGSFTPALFTEDTTGTNVQFNDDWAITDLVRDLVEVSASLTSAICSLEWNEKASDYYGTCGDSYDVLCGGSPITLWAETLEGYMGPVSTTSGHDIIMPDCPTTEGENPTTVDGEFPACACDSLYCTSPPQIGCGQCPPPYAAMELELPSSCNPGDNARVCSGISYWVYSTIVCV